jgi:hypothetical protein
VILRRFDAQQHRTDDSCDETADCEAVERGVEADVLVEERERNCGDGAAERNGHLADAQREPALVLAEPGHHRATAGRIDAGSDCSGER